MRQSGAGAADWAGVEGEGRAGTATAAAGSAEPAAGASFLTNVLTKQKSEECHFPEGIYYVGLIPST